ncbi:sugar kinase [Sphingopyxis sp. JAI128]|uniref:sugar kinase n=1 Tax=Sphingopyxis sp. JAI128 TaxID=2723066 RepID=UPI0017DC5F9E|nr:sugar kinase [Sphingopyxis sp. JAI128]MBB6427798.1 2-dehydro-3-deoxygluconokinase [Sphingopyxis sp. JAI128]
MMQSPRNIACFGEVVMRVSVPCGELPLQSPRFDAHVGGAEANVAVALAALGRRSTMISAIPAGPIGDGVLGEMRRHGVAMQSVLRPAGRMGLYYHIPAGPMRPADVVYDRAGSAFAEVAADDWDWGRLLSGADWLHVSGVTPALGPGSAEAALAAVTSARAAGIGVSFDGNWRGRLWERWQPDPAAILRPIIAQATMLFGNHRDAALLLGQEFSGDGEDRRREAALALLEAFPALEYVASTARDIVSADTHRLTARIDTRTEGGSSEPALITPIVDRIGTGDAFAAGVLDGLWQGQGLADAATNGLALAALKHGLRGDFAPFSRSALMGTSAAARDVAR